MFRRGAFLLLSLVPIGLILCVGSWPKVVYSVVSLVAVYVVYDVGTPTVVIIEYKTMGFVFLAEYAAGPVSLFICLTDDIADLSVI